TEADLKEAYEQVRVRHILIEPDGDDEASWAAAEERAKEVRERLLSGADFAALARELSDDTGSKERGGDLGFIGHDAPLAPPFIEAAFSLDVGAVSEPVRTQFGYHLIQVTEKRAAAGEAFEKAKESLRQQIAQEKGAEAFQQWLDAERAKARILVHDPAMRAMQFVRNGQLPQAVAQYQEAIEQDPSNPYLQLMLGQVYEQLEDRERALAAFQRAVELGPNDAELHYQLGRAYQERDMIDQAVASFKKASELAPLDLVLHQVLQATFTSMGRTAEAEAEAAKVEEIQQILRERQEAQQRMQQQQAQPAPVTPEGSGPAQGSEAAPGEAGNAP
ncbi:MAG TPA: peptidylprolyl isomerase, partial [Limnochordia bacterium]